MRASLKRMVLASVVALTWACTTPTELCSCAIERSLVVVTGTIRDARGAPLMNTAFVIEAIADLLPQAPAATTEVRTDAAGGFAAPIYSGYPPGIHALAARFVQTTRLDTTRVPIGRASFKRQSADTVRVTLQLP